MTKSNMTVKQKPKELFEGKNSSLFKTFQGVLAKEPINKSIESKQSVIKKNLTPNKLNLNKGGEGKIKELREYFFDSVKNKLTVSKSTEIWSWIITNFKLNL